MARQPYAPYPAPVEAFVRKARRGDVPAAFVAADVWLPASPAVGSSVVAPAAATAAATGAVDVAGTCTATTAADAAAGTGAADVAAAGVPNLAGATLATAGGPGVVGSCSFTTAAESLADAGGPEASGYLTQSLQPAVAGCYGEAGQPGTGVVWLPTPQHRSIGGELPWPAFMDAVQLNSDGSVVYVAPPPPPLPPLPPPLSLDGPIMVEGGSPFGVPAPVVRAEGRRWPEFTRRVQCVYFERTAQRSCNGMYCEHRCGHEDPARRAAHPTATPAGNCQECVDYVGDFNEDGVTGTPWLS